MLYKIKKDSKTYDFVKDLLDKESAEREAYYARVVEAIGFEVENYKGYTPNSSFTRENRISAILVSKDFYEKDIDKKIWSKADEAKDYVLIKPNKRTKKGKEIQAALLSCKSFTDCFYLNEQLDIKTELHGRFSITQLLRKGDFLAVAFDESIRADRDNPDFVEITRSEFESIK